MEGRHRTRGGVPGKAIQLTPHFASADPMPNLSPDTPPGHPALTLLTRKRQSHVLERGGWCSDAILRAGLCRARRLNIKRPFPKRTPSPQIDAFPK